MTTLSPRKSGPPIALFLCMLLCGGSAQALAASAPDPDALLKRAIYRWVNIVEPDDAQAPQTFSAHVRLTKAQGLPAPAAGASGELAYQAPNLLRVSAHVAGETYSAGRDHQRLWVHEPGKKFGVIGQRGIARFKADPTSIDATVLAPFELPISRFQLRLALLAVTCEYGGHEKIGDADCDVLNVSLSKAAEIFNIHAGQARLWLRRDDQMPMRVTYVDGPVNVQVDITDPELSDPWPASRWALSPAPGDKIETVALSHLTNFIQVAPRLLHQNLPTLGPATGRHTLVARSGKGRLEMVDGTRVLFLKGSPEQMGRQHGELLKPEIHDMAERILYGVGVGSSFVKGRWFFGEIENAQSRLDPFMDPRYLREEDALAQAAGMNKEESRLANFFPELFHCSGFALMGAATRDGHLYHGRVLDYMRGIGLEQNAVVMVHQPDAGRLSWVNLSYAGFVGSVTAMNEKGIAIGEMGGQGAGKWDGKPMAHLIREVMEKACTLDQAVAIMKRGPRTCAYYYVISDGKSKTAIGIAATPDTFETIQPGQADSRLPHAMADTVLLSAGDRYEELARRVKAGYGQFDAKRARDLMTRPVCMTNNIQSVLFRPDTLDLWVANADSTHVASATRYTHYNLRELLDEKPPTHIFGF